MSKEPLGVVASDIHLSSKAPVARSTEPDWVNTQALALEEISGIAKNLNVPLIIAGDIFHKHKDDPIVITMAMDYLEGAYVIPGQHDLPYHDYNEMPRSSFGVLVRSGMVNLIDPKYPKELENIILFGFPWGYEITPQNDTHYEEKGLCKIAVVHAFCWYKEHTHVGAKKSTNAVAYKKKLQGYDVAVFGDNHLGFTIKSGKTTIHNNGMVLRRNINEVNREPCVGIIYDDGSVERHTLKYHQADVIIDAQKLKRMIGTIDEVDVEGFIEELEKLGDAGLDYRKTINEYCTKKKVSKSVKKLLLNIIDNE